MIDINDNVPTTTGGMSNYWQPYYPICYIDNNSVNSPGIYLTGGTLHYQQDRGFKPLAIHSNHNLNVSINNSWHIKQSYCGFANNHNQIESVNLPR
jgi:hypothetical protein